MTLRTLQTDQLTVHKITKIFPRMDAAAFAELAADIKENGQRVPILVCDGAVIDGVHRFEVCRDLGRAILAQEVKPEDIVSAAVSANLYRRQLDTGQRAAVIDELANIRTPKQRTASACKANPNHQKAKAKNANRTDKSRNDHDDDEPLVTVKEAAEKVTKVAGGTVEGNIKATERYRAVKKKNPELAEQVKNGKMKLNAAAKKAAEHKTGNKARDEKAKRIRTRVKKASDQDLIAEAFKHVPTSLLIKIRRQFAKEVEAEVAAIRKQAHDERVAMVFDFTKREAELSATLADARDRRDVITGRFPLSLDDYRVIIGCLHPDRHTGREEAAKKATLLFQKLKKYCKPTKARKATEQHA